MGEAGQHAPAAVVSVSEAADEPLEEGETLDVAAPVEDSSAVADAPTIVSSIVGAILKLYVNS